MSALRCPGCHARCSGKTPVCPGCGADLDRGRQVDPLIGTSIDGRYRVVEAISEGGMGRIYRAVQVALGNEVAVKVIRPELAANREVASRFFREARVAAMLSHPSCVNIIDFGEADGTLYLAMELLRGVPLDRLLTAAGPLSPDRAVGIATQVLDVLAAAHQLTIVHRDLKPENILIEQTATRGDFVKVVDFGIAKITDPLRESGQALTQAGTIVGTPAYMAPEQVLGRPVDTRSDIYSLGVICYEMLARRTPFSGNIGELLRAHLSETAEPLASLRPDIPAALARLIDQMLAKEPGDRPGGAAGGAAELARQLVDALGDVEPPGDGGDGDRFGALRRHLPAAVVDAVASLGGDDRARRELVVVVFELSGDDPGAVAMVPEVTAALSRIAGAGDGRFELRDDGTARVTYGVERALADDVERAVRAILAMRAEVAARARRSGVDLALTAAIHAGPAVIGDAGVEPAGDLYELPARLLGGAATRQIVASHAIARRLGAWCRSRRLAAGGHEIIGLSDDSAPVARFRPPLVGRDREVADLVALARRGGVIDIDGELGIGKSRVIEAVAAALASGGAAVLSGAGPGAIDALIRGCERRGLADCGLRPDQIELIRRFRAGSRLARAGRELEVIVAATLRDALVGWAGDVEQPGLAAVVIDGLDRAGPVAAELARQLAADRPHNLALIAASRTGHPRPWADLGPAPPVARETLGPLGSEAVGAMVEGVFAAASRAIGEAAAPAIAVPPWITEQVSRRAGGSPLMVMELFGALIDAGAIAPARGGGWTLATEPVELPPAPGFAGLIAQRLDALDDRRRALCAALAVAGRPMHRADLAALVGVPIGSDVDALRVRQLLALDGDQIGFASDAVAEIVRAQLSADEARRWHRGLAEALDARGDPETVAGHYLAAGLWGPAIDKLEGAARKASALDRAAALWTRAMEAASQQHRQRRDAESASRLCEVGLRAAEAWRSIGDLRRLADVTSKLLPVAADTGDARIRARLERLRALLALARGDTSAALRGLDDVIAAALAARDGQLYAEAHADLGEVHEKRGALDDAADCLVRSLELAQRGSSDEVKRLSLRVLLALGRVQLRRDTADRAFELLEQALELARGLDDPTAEARALGNIAAVHHARADLAAAIESAERSLDVSRRCGDQIGAARQLNNLGTLHIGGGDWERAAARFDEAYAAAQRIGWREGMASAAAGRDQVAAMDPKRRHR